MLDKLEAALQKAVTLTEPEKAQIRERFPHLEKDTQEKVLAMLMDEEAILQEAAAKLTE